MLPRRILPLLTMTALAACQDYGRDNPTEPQIDHFPLSSFLSSPTKVAVPVTIKQVLGGLMYPGPVGIAVAPLGSLEDFQLFKPLDEAVAYTSVFFLPGGKEALATATVPSADPPYPHLAGWAQLLKFDVETGELTGKVLLEGVPGTVWEEGGDAWRMDVTRDGRVAYVSLFYSERIAVVDLRAMEFVTHIELPTPAGSSRFYPQDPELVEGDRALLVNDQATGQVLRIDTQTFQIQEAYSEGLNNGTSTSITVSNDGKILLVSSTAHISVVDLQSGRLISSIPCLYPTGHQFLSGDREFVVGCRDEDRLLVVGRKDWSVDWEMTIPGGPHRVDVTESGKYAVFSTWYTNELVLVDLSKKEILNRVPMPNRLWAPEIWPGHFKD